MRHAILDRFGYVVTLGEFDDVKPGMVPVPDDKHVPFLQRKIKYVNGDFVTTDQPTLPPARHLTWAPERGTWVDARTDEQAWESVRGERAVRLAASDWTTLSDVPMATEVRAQWAAYRQALRDVTDQPDPRSIVWPVAPSN